MTIIQHAVWLYHRFPLSYRDVQELLHWRSIQVSHETIREWCTKFGPLFAVVSGRGPHDSEWRPTRAVEGVWTSTASCLRVGADPTQPTLWLIA